MAKLINHESVSRPSALEQLLNAMDTEIDSLRTLANELRTDAATQKTLNDELIADHATFKTVVDEVVAWAEALGAKLNLDTGVTDADYDATITAAAPATLTATAPATITAPAVVEQVERGK